ncbi:hypothetical protein ACWGJP_08675 [Microbacterium sp. NPDC055903]
MNHPPLRRGYAALALAALAWLLAGCVASIPVDPGGTLAQVRGGTLQVGMSVEPGVIEAGAPSPDGPLAEVVDGFAAELGASVEWTAAGEETLIGMLEDGGIDLAVGGFSDRTPWAERVGATRGYDGLPGLDGRSIVLLVPAGENALLAELEAYLDEEAEG